MSARAAKVPLAALEPRVQLLPPMVKQREKNRRTRRLMAFAVVVAVVVVAAATAFGYLRAAQAATALADEQARTAQILAQQSEFSEAARVDELVGSTTRARLLVTSTEVRWSAALAEMNARVPEGYSVVKASAKFAAPWEAALAPAGVLRGQGVAFVTLVLDGTDYRSPADFTHVVSFLDGVSDFQIDRTEIVPAGYRTTVTFALDTSKLAQRFLEADDESADGDDEDEVDE